VVVVRLVHTPRLVVSHSTCPPLSMYPPPRAHLCFRYCNNKEQLASHGWLFLIETFSCDSPSGATGVSLFTMCDPVAGPGRNNSALSQPWAGEPRYIGLDRCTKFQSPSTELRGACAKLAMCEGLGGGGGGAGDSGRLRLSQGAWVCRNASSRPSLRCQLNESLKLAADDELS
jgi:hypothetical protein